MCYAIHLTVSPPPVYSHKSSFHCMSHIRIQRAPTFIWRVNREIKLINLHPPHHTHTATASHVHHSHRQTNHIPSHPRKEHYLNTTSHHSHTHHIPAPPIGNNSLLSSLGCCLCQLAHTMKQSVVSFTKQRLIIRRGRWTTTVPENSIDVFGSTAKGDWKEWKVVVLW